MSDHEKANPDEIETGTAGRACDACHRKKTKCDMQQPVCGLCRRTNRECHFPSTRKRPSRQEPSVRAKLQKVNGNLDRLVELLEANPGLESDTIKGILGHNDSSRGSITASSSSPPGRVSRNNSKAATSPSRFGSKSVASPVNTDANSPYQPYPVSRELALHLIDLYFEHIQPWLALIHKPSLAKWSDQLLGDGEDTLANVEHSVKVLCNSIFALSARFSDHPSLAHLKPRERGERFMRATEYWLRVGPDVEELDLTGLKGYIMLAYYHYASGSSKRGWYITHMCIRGCYELSLHLVDEGNDEEELSDSDWIMRESLRRAFWAIYELDTFGSIVRRKPFAIDHRHVEVNMPISDEDWFSTTRAESTKFIPGPDCWKTLVGSPNQSGKAWTLLSKALVAHAFDLMLYKEGVTADQITAAENSVSCFKMAMPETFQLTSASSKSPDISLSDKNWVIATNLYLGACSFVITQLPTINQLPSPEEEAHSNLISSYTHRVNDLNEILKRWPPEALPYAFPCLCCTILTYDEALVNSLPPSPAIDAYRNLSGLILSRVAERWQLGAVLLRVRHLAYNYHKSDAKTKAELIRQYPLYFAREIQRDRKTMFDEAHGRYTPAASIGSPSAASVRARGSIDQSHSPEQTSLHRSPSQTQQFLPIQPPQQPNFAQAPSNFEIANPFDTLYDPGSNVGTDVNMQNFSSFSNPSQSPEDIDALFSGFLQEPWWQDFNGLNFVV